MERIKSLKIVRDNLYHSIPVARDWTKEEWREVVEEHISELDELIEDFETKILLTEDNIKDYGFKLYRIAKFIWYQFPDNNHMIGLSTETNIEYQKGSWYFGQSAIKIDTVEELKQLYKLVTKKELI